MDLKALYKVTYGMYVIGSKQGEKLNGQIANTVIQVTAETPAVAVAINKQNFTHGCIENSRAFSVSILAKDTPISFIGGFGFRSGRDVDKLQGINYKIGLTGVPVVLDNAIGSLEVNLKSQIDVGTHTIFVGEVVEAEVLRDAEPMTYAYYHEIKGGTTPKTAPHYIKPETHALEKKMKRYVCTVCGYIYDPTVGDPDSGIKPGTPFEELPDDWVCPVCGADKSKFEPEA